MKVRGQRTSGSQKGLAVLVVFGRPGEHQGILVGVNVPAAQSVSWFGWSIGEIRSL